MPLFISNILLKWEIQFWSSETDQTSLSRKKIRFELEDIRLRPIFPVISEKVHLKAYEILKELGNSLSKIMAKDI